MQNTHAGTRPPPGPTIMPGGRLEEDVVVGMCFEERERSIGRSREDFEGEGDRLNFGLSMFSIEKERLLEVVDEAQDEKELSESGDPQLLGYFNSFSL